jgi:formylglycine-generating enzyme required for sulfatase activity
MPKVFISYRQDDSSDAAESEPPSQQPMEILANSVGMRMVLVPAGEFLMGSPASDSHARSWEMPQHRVRITRPFYLGIHPVTQQEYEQVMGDNPSNFKGDARLPVENASWLDAVQFCNRLSERESLAPCYRIDGDDVTVVDVEGLRLPTEAEWEYACRAGTTTKWYCGDAENGLGEVAWYGANSGGKTHPVGKKKPNAWGLFDMHGNVWEWCEDWYREYPAEEVTDPQGPSQTPDRVLRGGSCRGVAWHCRAAFRDGYGPRSRFDFLGFRVAAVPPGRPSQKQ